MRNYKLCLVICVIFLIFLICGSWLRSRPYAIREWDVKPYGSLRFYKTRTGQITGANKFLEWTKPGGNKIVFLIDSSHAGYENVELRRSEDGEAVWLVDIRGQNNSPRIGALINLITGIYYNEAEIWFASNDPIATTDKQLLAYIKLATPNGGRRVESGSEAGSGVSR